jgi:hypothetical protein
MLTLSLSGINSTENRNREIYGFSQTLQELL